MSSGIRELFEAARNAKTHGDVARAAGLVKRALSKFTHGCAAAEGSEGLVLRGRLLHLSVQLDLLRHHLTSAERDARTALVLFEEAGDLRRQAMAWEDLGSIALLRVRPSEAIRLFAQALSLSETAEARARLRVNLALAHQQLGGVIAADRELAQAAELFGAAGRERERVVALLNAAVGRAWLGSHSGIERLIEQVREAGIVSRHPELYSRFLMLRGIVESLAGNAPGATRLLRKALYANEENLQSEELKAEIRVSLANVIARRGERPGRAITILEDVIAELDEDAGNHPRIDALRILSLAHHARGEKRRATEVFDEAEALLDQDGLVLSSFRLFVDRAACLLRDPGPIRTRAIRPLLQRARNLAHRIDAASCALEVELLEAELAAATAPEEGLVALDELDARLAELLEKCSAVETELLQRLAERVERVREAAREAMQRALDDNAMAVGEILKGLRSEDIRAHITRLIAAITDRVGAQRAFLAMGSGEIDLVGAIGWEEETALPIARRLLAEPPEGPSRGPSEEGITSLLFPLGRADEPAGIFYVERDAGMPPAPFGPADLKTFAFLASGLVALSRIEPPAPRSSTDPSPGSSRDDLVSTAPRYTRIITRSPSMLRVLDAIDVVKDTDLPLLLLGASGTGKEMVAGAVHENGPRAGGPFVAVNCAAVPRELLEAELFGYARGAFTGAQRDKPGFFQAADGGTLFLDEIGEMPADVQAKLLRAIEEKIVIPVGSTRGQKVDFRIVAATNAAIEAAVAEGVFREDLYYRLNAFQVELPSLRDRPGDIMALAEHFLAEHELRLGDGIEFSVTSEAREALELYPWPGNVRELRNVVLASAAFAARKGGRIECATLPARVSGAREEAPLDEAMLARLYVSIETSGYRQILDDVERYVLAQALERSGGNRRAAARSIALEESSIRTKLKRLGMRMARESAGR